MIILRHDVHLIQISFLRGIRCNSTNTVTLKKYVFVTKHIVRILIIWNINIVDPNYKDTGTEQFLSTLDMNLRVSDPEWT
jgi:hypothetical protein